MLEHCLAYRQYSILIYSYALCGIEFFLALGFYSLL
jgi:hypothetical protein